MSLCNVALMTESLVFVQHRVWLTHAPSHMHSIMIAWSALILLDYSSSVDIKSIPALMTIPIHGLHTHACISIGRLQLGFGKCLYPEGAIYRTVTSMLYYLKMEGTLNKW